MPINTFSPESSSHVESLSRVSHHASVPKSHPTSSAPLAPDKIGDVDARSQGLIDARIGEARERLAKQNLGLNQLCEMIRERQISFTQKGKSKTSGRRQEKKASQAPASAVATQATSRGFSGAADFSDQTLDAEVLRTYPINEQSITEYLTGNKHAQQMILDKGDADILDISPFHISILSDRPNAHATFAELENRISRITDNAFQNIDTFLTGAKSLGTRRERAAAKAGALYDRRLLERRRSGLLQLLTNAKHRSYARHVLQENLSEEEKAERGQALHELLQRYAALLESPRPSMSEAFAIYSKANALDLKYGFEPGSREQSSLRMMNGLSQEIGRAFVELLAQNGVKPSKVLDVNTPPGNALFDEAVLKLDRMTHKFQAFPRQEDYHDYTQAHQEMLALDFCIGEEKIKESYRPIARLLLGIDQSTEFNQALHSRMETTPEREIQALRYALHDLFADQKPSTEKAAVASKTQTKKKSKHKQKQAFQSSPPLKKESPFAYWSLNELSQFLQPTEDDRAKAAEKPTTRTSKSPTTSQNYHMELLDHSQMRFDQRFMDQIYRGRDIPADTAEQERAKVEFARSIILDPQTYTRPLIPLGNHEPDTWRDGSCLVLDGHIALIVHDPIDKSIQPHEHSAVKIHSAYWVNDSYVQRRLVHEGRPEQQPS